MNVTAVRLYTKGGVSTKLNKSRLKRLRRSLFDMLDEEAYEIEMRSLREVLSDERYQQMLDEDGAI